ncbi:MAG TPA: ribosome assembly RNA-binding protein YhbY [Dokdonella sp.]|uniref:ribosome assembly RNA-binding protein YhbY n=1 Tax=Dokdonella sp. TaxID=2291710 RepID=UPI002C039AA3|nr:ribosome assembly RNA-binding protein YhbY [Dokdonella sp.]HOX72794.1 ribosome assembly RNA-binding protein YhbY [Dokdonella sp.]HPG95456.1 ribosome assembly RNA-binding protein YhbY [Dokdonella sp.]HPN80156.1 ribosome assembly RNA-binding protein YhbY [Dokdonella sp.]
MPLTSFQKRYLRGLAHSLSPVVMLGQKGVTPSLVAELGLALNHHELVKVRLSGGDREERAAQIEALIQGSTSELVQLIGHTATLWKRNDKEPKLPLPS